MTASSNAAASIPALVVEDIRVLFGGVVALDGVSFALPRGSATGLIGPNGSGKTTLVNVISGVLRPTAGNVFLNGARITHLPPYRVAGLGLARTFQIARPFASLTVLENVAVGAMFGRGSAGMSANAAKIAAGPVLERVGLADRAGDRAASLGVMDRKRLELARALAAEPQVLLLDEVLAGLRATELDEAIELLRSIHAAGTTILVIEHVLRVILSLCERVVVLNNGRLIAQGEPADVMRDPAVVTAYLGPHAAAAQGRTDA